MQTKTLSNGQEVWIGTFTGEVLSQEKSTSTSIHQTAATVLSKDMVTPGHVYSQTHVHHDVWLRSVDGKEKRVTLGGIGLAVRPGHIVTIAWGQSDASETGYNFAARNHTTGEVRSDVLAALGDGMKEWKLRVGAAGSFWRWTIGGTVLGGLVGGLWGRATAYAHSVPQDTLLGILGLGIPAFILTALFWMFIGMHFLLKGNVTRLVDEINDFAREQLGAAEAKVATVDKAGKPIEPIQSAEQLSPAAG